MELTHDFVVPLDIDRAFEVLTDVERVAPCVPGATLESADEGVFTGRVEVKVGPIRMTYRGTAELQEVDREARRAVLVARGQEAQGSGTANARVVATLAPAEGGRTAVTVSTDLDVTGRPAQFGRGVLQDVGGRIIDQFVDCLSSELSAPVGEQTLAEAPTGAPAKPVDAAPPVAATHEPIDLLRTAGGAIGKRVVLTVLALVAVVLVVRRVRGTGDDGE